MRQQMELLVLLPGVIQNNTVLLHHVILCNVILDNNILKTLFYSVTL